VHEEKIEHLGFIIGEKQISEKEQPEKQKKRIREQEEKKKKEEDALSLIRILEDIKWKKKVGDLM